MPANYLSSTVQDLVVHLEQENLLVQEVLTSETIPEQSERIYRATRDSESNVYLESDIEELGSDGSVGLPRTQQKAFAQELLWRHIDASGIPAFQECALKEWEEWLRWGSIKPYYGDVSIIPKDRILPSRYAYKWKPQFDGPPKAKGRIVVQGFRDPDLEILIRDIPV